MIDAMSNTAATPMLEELAEFGHQNDERYTGERANPRQLRIGPAGQRRAPGRDRRLQLPRQARAEAEGGGRRLTFHTALQQDTTSGHAVALYLDYRYGLSRGERCGT